MKKQVHEFITVNKLVPDSMHRSRKFYNKTMAKLEIHKEVNRQRDNRRQIANMSTDLMAAYKTVSYLLLLYKLKHICFREMELKLMTSYLADRNFFLKYRGSQVKDNICHQRVLSRGPNSLAHFILYSPLTPVS